LGSAGDQGDDLALVANRRARPLPARPSSACSSRSVAVAWHSKGSPTAGGRRCPDGSLLFSPWTHDLSVAVFAFVDAGTISQFASASYGLRTASSVKGEGGWRLLVPHLSLTSRSCASRLDHAWLPCVRWIHAASLNEKASKSLLVAFERPAPRMTRSLLTLDLSCTKITMTPSMIRVVRACRSLTSLNLSRTKLRDDDAEELAYGLVHDPSTGDFSPHPSLKQLSLDSNGLSGRACREIARAIAAVNLETLQLSRNDLGDAGAEALASALEQDIWRAGSGARLTRLDVSENRISAAGITALFRGLAENRTLRTLDAGGNDALGPSLAANPEAQEELFARFAEVAALRELHLWRCGLCDIGCQVLVDSQPPRLTMLNLAGNSLSPSMRCRLQQRLPTLPV